MNTTPHPYEEAIEFLLTNVARHGDGPSSERASGILAKVKTLREGEAAAEPEAKVAEQPA